MMDESKNEGILASLKPYPFKYLELPLGVIEEDPTQPRKTFGLRLTRDQSRLKKSISYYGIEDPIKVSEIEKGRYIIMDGHRRFSCAKELNLSSVPCRVYPKMNAGEFEARRYEMQNNRREWKPIEKANAVHKIKSQYPNANKKEIAELIGMTQQNLFHFTKLRDARLEYLELMSERGLKENQRIELLKLLPKLRKIKNFEVDGIVKIILDKINDNVMPRRQDFISLSRVFSTASLHEQEIERFLSEPQMGVKQLVEMTQLSGFSIQIQKVIKELTHKKNLDIKLTERELGLFADLQQLMQTLI